MSRLTLGSILAAGLVAGALLGPPAAAADPPGTIVGAGGRAASIAHRGASGDTPENTLVAFATAVAQGADFVEADVQRSSDGEIVVFHDRTLTRTTNVGSVFPRRRYQPVGSFTLAQLRRLDAGRWNDADYAGQRIPTLAELVSVMRAPTGLFIELKNPSLYPGIEAQIARELAAIDSDYLRWAQAERKLVVGSIDHAAVQRYHDASPATRVGVMQTPSYTSDATLRQVATYADFVGTGEALFSRAAVDRIHGFGLDVLSNTSTAWQMRRMARRGVDGIITDYPGRANDVTAGTAPRFFEAEVLAAQATVNAPLVRRGNCCMTGGKWSGDADLQLRGTREKARMTLPLDVPADGTYDLSVVVSKGPRNGIHKVLVDGVRVGARFDGYRRSVARETVPLGRFRFPAGPVDVTFKVVDRDRKADAYEVSVDVLALRRVAE